MTARQGLALVLAGVFSAPAGLHAAWAAAGAGPGAAVPARADGAPLFRPGRGLTLPVALALAGAAAVVLGRAGPLPVPVPWTRTAGALCRAGAWTLGAVLALRVVGDFRYVGLFERERAPPFAALDAWLYTPLCAALAAGVLVLAAS